MRSAILLLTLAAFIAPPTWAADLTKIERSIRKESAYQTKTPKYCLLVFGPEAKTRVWLVLDGDTLFVDRNGNGDLTDDGEKVTAKKKDDAGNLTFEVGDIHDGARTHKGLSVLVRNMDYLAERDVDVKDWLTKNPRARGYFLHADIEMPGWKSVGTGGRVEQSASFYDPNGFLAFADKPQNASIIHFGGPWRISLFGRDHLTVGRETDLVLGVGTPGLGAGTTTYIGYEGVVPEKAYPQVEITYPPSHSGDKPVKALYELKERC